MDDGQIEKIKNKLEYIESSSLSENEKEKRLDLVFQRLISSNNDSISRNLILDVANQYYNNGFYDKYVVASRKLFYLSNKQYDSLNVAKSLYYIGDYYSDKLALDSAFYYYSQSKKMYNLIKNKEKEGEVLLYLSGVLYDSGDFTESEIKAVEALELLSKTNQTRRIYECYNLIALSLEEIKNYNSSIEYFDLANNQLDVLEREGYSKLKLQKSRAAVNNNLGGLYYKKRDYKKAISFYNKAIKTPGLKENSPSLYAMVLNNLALSEMYFGQNTNVKSQLFKALAIRDSIQSQGGIVSSKKAIGQYFLHQKDTLKALSFLKSSYALATKVKAKDDIIGVLELLIENDLTNRKNYTKEYIRLNQNRQLSERKLRNKFARIAYETDQVESQNKNLIKRNVLILIFSSFFMLCLVGVFVFYRLKTKNKELIFIKEQQQSNEKIYQLMLEQQSLQEKSREEERNRIAMELHDGIVNGIFTTRFNLMQLPTSSEDKKQELIQELEKTEKNIRKISHDLMQNLLFEDNNLPEILNELVLSQQNQFDTKFDLTIDKYIDWNQINNSTKIHIYRIVQEALQNVNKYAKAQKCFIMILKLGNTISLRIWDDGIGFNVNEFKMGIGLKNMKERTSAMNGSFKITAEPEKGTAIEVVI